MENQKQKQNSNKKKSFLLFKLWKIYSPDIHRLMIGISALLVNSLTNLSFPMIMGQAIDQLEHNEDAIKEFFIRSSSIFFIGSLASWIRTYYLNIASKNIFNRFQKMLFQSYVNRDIDYFHIPRSGEAISLLEKDSVLASELFTDTLASGLRSLNSSIHGSIILFSLSPRLCGISLAIVPLIGIGAMKLSKFSRHIQDKLRIVESKLLSFSLERIDHISTVKLNGKEKYELLKFQKFQEESITLVHKASNAKGLFMSFLNITTNTSLLAILYVGGNMLRLGQITAGGLTRFAIQSAFVGLGFSGLSTFYSDMKKGLDAAERVFFTVDHEFNQQNEIDLAMTQQQDKKLIGDISVDINNISFAYNSRLETSIIKNMSIMIPKCSMIGIVGRSGEGKSTLLSLIAGLYPSTKGSISLNDIDISKLSHTELRRVISVVEQKSTLMSGSIFDNIAYGYGNDINEYYLEDLVIAAAKASYAHDFIMSFPNGYATEIGSNGCLLSGGQQVRIALARALIKKPKLLLLDEVSASLDLESEKAVIEALVNIRTSTTVIICTHSESIMKIVDRLYCIEKGEVIASGSFEDLPKDLVAFHNPHT